MSNLYGTGSVTNVALTLNVSNPMSNIVESTLNVSSNESRMKASITVVVLNSSSTNESIVKLND